MEVFFFFINEKIALVLKVRKKIFYIKFHIKKYIKLLLIVFYILRYINLFYKLFYIFSNNDYILYL